MLFEEILNERAAELEKLIAKARHDYYVNHAPSVSDETYDAWVDELRELNQNSPQVTAVGAPAAPSEWKKVRHEIPMGSLNKVNTLGEMTAWVLKVSGDSKYEELFVTEKLDGISIALQYEQGGFVRAVTRGDGLEGEDISNNVVKMKGVPGRLSKKFTGQIRGEIVVKLSDLAKHFPDYANPRNTASGIASRLDGAGCEHLSILVYQIAEGADHIKSKFEQFAHLAELGFHTPNAYKTAMVPGVKTPHDIWVEYQQTRRAELDYAIDGLVVELDSIEKQLFLGDTNMRPNGAVAFKFAPVTRETVLRKIECSTGAAGHITPVAIFDEVNLLGTRVTNASLYNWKYIRELKLDVGARILVARANDVIPRVVEVVQDTGKIAFPPGACSSCGAPTIWEGEYLTCPNTSDCPAQTTGRLLRYVKSLNILEWGETNLEKLVTAGLVKSVPDLYRLTEDQLANIERMGPKLARNMLQSLWSKNPISLESFFGALSIPGCGESMVALVVDAGYDTLDVLMSVSYEQLLSIHGLGPIRAKTLSDWFATHGDLIKDACSTGLQLKGRVKGTFTGISFCFTGKMKNGRSDLEALVKNAGGSVKSSVGKGLTYLVMSDPSSGSTKAQAAKKNGTKTISEDDFLKMLGQ